MAAKVTTPESVSSTKSSSECKIHQFQNGNRIFVVQEVGNTDRNATTLNYGATKVARIFHKDQEGDSILLEALEFCRKEMTDKDFKAVMEGVELFCQKVMAVK